VVRAVLAAKSPVEIVTKVHDDAVAALAHPQVKQGLEKLAMEVVTPHRPGSPPISNPRWRSGEPSSKRLVLSLNDAVILAANTSPRIREAGRSRQVLQRETARRGNKPALSETAKIKGE